MIDDWRARMRHAPKGAEVGWLTAGDGVKLRYLVAAPEWRGQGLSGRELNNPDKGHIRSYDQYVGDLRRFVAKRVAGILPAPYILIGYSMGGLAASLYLIETGGAAFSKAILVAPLFRARTGGVPNWLVRGMAQLRLVLNLGGEYVPGRGDFSFEDAEQVWPSLVTAPDRFYEVRAHIVRQPGLRLGGPTWRWLAETFAAIDKATPPEALAQVEPELHLIVAELDQLLFNHVTRATAEGAQARSYTEIPGAQHDLFVERTDIRKLAMAAIFDALSILPAAP